MFHSDLNETDRRAILQTPEVQQLMAKLFVKAAFDLTAANYDSEDPNASGVAPPPILLTNGC